MQEAEDKKEYLKTGWKIAFKTVFSFFVFMMLSFTFLLFLFPDYSLKLSESFGFVKIKEEQYEMIYRKSGKLADLYNLIIFEQSQKNYENELKNINLMLSSEDYLNFCVMVDDASLSSIKSNEMIPYACDVNAYLTNQKTICMFNLGSLGIETYILNQTRSDNLTEHTLATFVDLVDQSELTNAQKTEKIETVFETGLLIGQELIKVEDCFENRIEKLKTAINIETNANKKVILQYSLMRNYSAGSIVYNYLGDENKKYQYYSLYNEIKTKLEILINSL